jgi:nucleotide-binding universal stress UspA family protein
MTTATERPEAGSLVHDERVGARGPILVATDGTESSGAALRAAATFARDAGVAITVIAVMDSLPLVGADYGILIPPIDASPARRTVLMERIQSQVSELPFATET